MPAHYFVSRGRRWFFQPQRFPLINWGDSRFGCRWLAESLRQLGIFSDIDIIRYMLCCRMRQFPIPSLNLIGIDRPDFRRSLAEQLGGELSISSTLNAGTTVKWQFVERSA